MFAFFPVQACIGFVVAGGDIPVNVPDVVTGGVLPKVGKLQTLTTALTNTVTGKFTATLFFTSERA